MEVGYRGRKWVKEKEVDEEKGNGGEREGNWIYWRKVG